jgi:hypothetical protein
VKPLIGLKAVQTRHLQPVVMGQTAADSSNLLGIRLLGIGLPGIRISVFGLPSIKIPGIGLLGISFFGI